MKWFPLSFRLPLSYKLRPFFSFVSPMNLFLSINCSSHALLRFWNWWLKLVCDRWWHWWKVRCVKQLSETQNAWQKVLKNKTWSVYVVHFVRVNAFYAPSRVRNNVLYKYSVLILISAPHSRICHVYANNFEPSEKNAAFISFPRQSRLVDFVTWDGPFGMGDEKGSLKAVC